MDDLISRKAFMDHVEKEYTQWGSDYDIEQVLGDLEDFPGAQASCRQVNGWIPCSERLPEKGREVLVCYDFKGHRSVLIGTLYGDGKFHGYDDEYLTPEGSKYRKAVAWMPLPEPYGGETNETD